MEIGSGSHRYQLVEDWEQVPEGISHPDVASVAVGPENNVYLLTRSDDPVLVYDSCGRFVKTWGHGRFTLRAHGIYASPRGTLFIVDESVHHVAEYDLDGRLLRTIGPSGVPSDTGYEAGDIGGTTVKRAAGPFNRPTNVAESLDGRLFIADGYGNARIHVFDPTGELIRSWGQPGSGPGEFRLVHDLALHPDGRLFVADSANDRLQIFDLDGNFLTDWTDIRRPRGLHIDGDGYVYVGELTWRAGQQSHRRGPLSADEPSRVSIFDPAGNLVLRWGQSPGAAPGMFVAPHALTVDAEGSLFVAEVTHTIGVKTGLVPAGTHTFQKFQRI